MNRLTSFPDSRTGDAPEPIDRRLRMLEKALETTQLGVTITDTGGKILFTNRAEAEMHGYEVEELLGEDVRIFAPREKWSPMGPDDLRQVGSLRRETTNVRRDGSTFPVQLLSDVVVDRDGEPIGVVTTCEDISQRKEVERKLEILGKVFETTQLGVTVTDTDGRILYANPAEAEMHGREVRDLIHEDVRIFAPKELWNPMNREQIREFRKGSRQSINVRQDGSRFPVQLMSDVVTDPHGEPIAIVTTSEDISLTTAIEQVAEAIMVTDENGTIRYVNPAFERITGFPNDEAVGRDWEIVHSRNGDDALHREMRATLERGQVWQGRFTYSKKDGGGFEADATISPVRDPSGAISSFVFVARDVTREVMLDEQLRQAQKMEAVGQLAGGIAHDFNNLLVAIQGHAYLALDGRGAPDAVREEILGIQLAAERAATLTRQLLAFSRRQVLEPADLALNDVITDLVKMLRRLISEDIDLVLVPGTDLGIVHADRGQLEQVLMNLCVNARDAMPEGGTITVKTENAAVDGEPHDRHPRRRAGDFLRLSVIDTGCGMDETTLARVFEPFFTTKAVGRGSGLGLATVHGIVKQHDGWIEVDSRPGAGTRFEIYLPVIEEAAGNGGPKVPAAAATSGHETILVAEDDEIVRTVCVRALQKAGYDVLIAKDGGEAVRRYQEDGDRIALVLLDVVMPGMGGVEARQRILELEPAARILLASGYGSHADGLQSPADGEAHWIAKPYSLDGLLVKVRDVLDA